MDERSWLPGADAPRAFASVKKDRAMTRAFYRFFTLLLALPVFLAASPALAQNVGDACTGTNRTYTVSGASNSALICNGTTLELLEKDLSNPVRKGIGTASPAATLDVAGETKIGNTSLACSGTTEGAQRYNSTSHVMEYCNGTSWVGFGSGVTSNCLTSDVTSGLVARWKFDESSGTSAADSSGNSLTGTLTNGPVWNPNNGYLNGALTFDGSNDYVTVADPGTGSVLDFAGGTSMTITAWVMVGFDASLLDFTILSKGATTGVDDANYSFFVGGGGGALFPELRFAFNNPSGTWHDFYGPEVPGIRHCC